MRVVAVVVSNGEPLYLQKNLEALEKQSFRIERTLVVDSSQNEETKTLLDVFINNSTKHAVLQVQENASFAELSALAIKQVLDGLDNLAEIAIWLIHDDSFPEVHALAELVRTLELSPLVGISSPKQLNFEQPKLIAQQGLTLTKTLKPFSIVNDELDQKQYDWMSDVLSVTSNAMLIRANVWAELGGFSLVAPELASDVDLGIRTHQLGYRVVVVPTARVRHAQLSLAGNRDKDWLGGSVKYALAKATNHLRLSHFPLFFSFLYWLGLPVLSIFQVAKLLLVKRPDRILFTLRANLWAFFTIRARLRDRHRTSLRSLRPLFANSSQIKARSRLALEFEEQKSNLANFKETTVVRGNLVSHSFTASGGLWVLLGLIALSYKYFPLGQAPIGGFALPLSDRWLQLFANTGASFQHVGLGLVAPSDPFNWVLLLIGSITFFSPNVALSFVLLLAIPMSFFGAWRLLSTITLRNSLKIPLALVYAFWPALSLSQSEGNFPSVVFAVCLPWLLFCLVRSGRFGISSSVRSSTQSWSWIAASSLLLAIAVASAPSTLGFFVVLGMVYAYLTRSRIASTLLIALPTGAIMSPYLIHQIFVNQVPLAVLADPTISYPSIKQSVLDSVLGQNQILGLCAVGLIGLALISLLFKVRLIAGIWVLALLALANLWIVNSFAFTSGGTGSIFLAPNTKVFNSPTPSVMLSALFVVIALSVWLDSRTRVGARRVLVGLVVTASLIPLIIGSVLTPSKIVFAESRNLPAIFEAEAKAGNNLRLLVVSRLSDFPEQRFGAEIVRANGLRLDSISTAYRFSSQNIEVGTITSTKGRLSELVGNLVSANGKELKSDLEKSGIGFVLVTNRPGNGDIAVSLNSVVELDQVGTTEFGQLWRVKGSDSFKLEDEQSLWSITKSIQLSILTGFILLALPTSRGRKARKPEDSFDENSFQSDEEQ
jgi:GT2 family glycosyltransferase